MTDNPTLFPLTEPEPPPKIKPFSVIDNRLTRANLALHNNDSDTLFQHSILCQTCMPYRDPGSDIRVWERSQGNAMLRIEAGAAAHPSTKKWIDLGLPFGPKPRLILAYLNTEAVRTGSPTIDVQDTLTAFIKRVRLNADGRTFNTVREQLTRLSGADFRLGYADGQRADTVKATIIRGFSLWLPKNENQRVLWQSTVHFSQEYFDSLLKHAVPLQEVALAALSHNAMALDIYAWLAQRLHRVNTQQLVPWVSLHEQFGQGYRALTKFRQIFKTTLHQVAAVYPDSRFDLDGRGMILYNSPPPVLKALVTKI